MPLPVELLAAAALVAQAPAAAGNDAVVAARRVEGSLTVGGRSPGPDAVVVHVAALPAGSVAEVTALDDGRTILALVADRDAETGDVGLSRGAAALLGGGDGARRLVRVREGFADASDRALLLAGKPAAPRLAAPVSLLIALRRRVPAAPPAAPRLDVPASLFRSPDAQPPRR